LPTYVLLTTDISKDRPQTRARDCVSCSI